jgi:uncharacterized protein YabE (DUF348 family)
VRRSIQFGVYGLVLGGLVAGTVAWTLIDKTVTIRLDGQDRTVHTVSRTVSGALADAKINVDNHDVVAPAVDTAIKDGSTIVVRQGRLLKLMVDGQPMEIWVTATTVEQALSQLGYDAGSYSSVSRSKRLPLDPTTIELRTPKSVTVVADGVARPVLTTGTFASDAVTAAGVTFTADDLWSVPASTALSTGMTVTLRRVTYADVAESAEIPFDTAQSEDVTLTNGKTVIDTRGTVGEKSVTYRVTYIDGLEAVREPLAESVSTAPVTQVQRIGTKPVVTVAVPATPATPSAPAAPVPSSGSAQDIAHAMVLAQGWGEGEFSCLVSLWNRESGWRVNAYNPSGAYGIPQALPGSKMASAGADWQTNPATQITWGLGYIEGRYGTPCGAWGHSQSSGWY